MLESFQRIGAMFMRYLYLHRRSVSRTLELVFWPVMELFVWGFLSVYIQTTAQGPLARVIVFLISAMIFWDILYRSQQGVTISIIEDVWSNNILNLLISPLKIWEWMMAMFLYGFVKTLVITLMLSFIAWGFYEFDLIEAIGFYLIPFVFNLLLFGWALGIFTSGLLIRWGRAVQALIWGIPFLIQPLSAIFYPLSVLPHWVQMIAKCIPSTYVFEGMRSVITYRAMSNTDLTMAFILNIVYFVIAALFFGRMYVSARKTGRLGRLGMD